MICRNLEGFYYRGLTFKSDGSTRFPISIGHFLRLCVSCLNGSLYMVWWAITSFNCVLNINKKAYLSKFHGSAGYNRLYFLH